MHDVEVTRQGSCFRMVTYGKNVLYINGDSWLAHYTNRATSSDNPLFKNFLVINHSVPGASNIDIIRRTRVAINHFKKQGIDPLICIGLSEAGRGSVEEISLLKPNTSDLTTYLGNLLSKQFDILKQDLADYQTYLCTAWVNNPVGTKSIIDFIDLDFNKIPPVYTVSNGIYHWLSDRLALLKISKESLIDAVDNKRIFESALLGNPFISDDLHLDKKTSDMIYDRFFSHVLSSFDN